MRINTNVSSLTAQENSVNTNKNIQNSLEKLSSGLRINKASDDASGLSIADKLRTQATSINQGVANGNSAITLMQIADKSMAEQSNILDIVKAKLIQANTDTTSDEGREAIRKDISKLLEQLDNIAEQTNYNGNVLLQAGATDQGESSSLSFQVGETSNDLISNTTIQSNTAGLGSKVTYSAANQNNTITSADSALTVSSAGTITLNATESGGGNTAEKFTLEGDVDSILLTAGMTLSNLDTTTEATLTSGLTLGTDYSLSAGTYTMITTNTLSLTHNDAVSATVTTPAEASSTYTPVVGDVLSSVSQNENSALFTALADATKYTDNNDGTYTAKAGAGAVVLEVGESIAVATPTSLSLSNGDVVTSGVGTDVAGYLSSGANFTDNGDGTYTAIGAQSILIGQGSSVASYSPTTVTVQLGDYIDPTTLVASGAAEVALYDATKFDDINGDGSLFKAITNTTLSLVKTESVDLTAGLEVSSSSGAMFGIGSTITVSGMISGGDLYNQLSNTGKFDVSGAVYTARENVITDHLVLGEDEHITVTNSEAVKLTTADISATGLVSDATITLNGVAADWDASTSSGNIIADGGTGGDAALLGANVDLVFVAAATATVTGTVAIKAGDVISSVTDVTTTGNEINAELMGSGNFVDNGDGTYTATTGTSLHLIENGDTFTVTRKVGTGAGTSEYTGNSAATQSAAVGTTNGPVSSTTTAPDAQNSVDITTSSTVAITNTSATDTDTLTVTGDGTNDVSNGGTQLSAIAAIGAGQLTSALADSFQAVVDDAITTLNGYRGDIGSTQNQVESAVRNLMTQATNVKAAESIIRDVDYAQESANFNKQNIIAQAGTYAISQANASQQNVLRLLQ